MTQLYLTTSPDIEKKNVRGEPLAFNFRRRLMLHALGMYI